MKKTFIFAVATIILASCNKQPAETATKEPIVNETGMIQRVEPLSWWTEMNTPLTLMFYGEDLANAQISVEPKGGIIIKGQHNAESKNYLFVDVNVKKAGTYTFTLKKEGREAKWDYLVENRRAGSKDRKSFTSADVIYLIMSDRFADGDESNNSTDNTREKADKGNINGRWGGDIQGIINNLDHISELGATAIWPTPLLLDDEENWSYHGYACGDYYHIDPRMGSNELYKEMVAKAHEKGLKFIMDIVPNHAGLAHWWIKDLPYEDWIHQYPTFTSTNNCFSTNYDPNASQYDLHLNESGWFDTHMPDMNLDNPDLLQYFKQWAVWWIEYADLDGLRVDTYPYNERMPMSEWCKSVREEYPNMNIVGECWTRPASAVAYWQAGALNPDGFNSNLPSVMDFPVEEAIRQALENEGNYWGGGLTKVYDAVSQDYLYADVDKLLLFVGNHDMDHIADVVYKNDPRRVKLAMTMIATMRGIPQLFAGDEYGQRSVDMSKGHSGLRQPLPEKDKLTDAERDMFEYQSKLFQFRKGEEVLHNGKTMHFMSRDNTYAYFRYNDEEAVFVFLNASDEPRIIPLDHYQEILSKYDPAGVDVISGKAYELRENPRRKIKIEPLSSIVVKLTK